MADDAYVTALRGCHFTDAQLLALCRRIEGLISDVLQDPAAPHATPSPEAGGLTNDEPDKVLDRFCTAVSTRPRPRATRTSKPDHSQGVQVSRRRKGQASAGNANTNRDKRIPRPLKEKEQQRRVSVPVAHDGDSSRGFVEYPACLRRSCSIAQLEAGMVTTITSDLKDPALKRPADQFGWFIYNVQGLPDLTLFNLQLPKVRPAPEDFTQFLITEVKGKPGLLRATGGHKGPWRSTDWPDFKHWENHQFPQQSPRDYVQATCEMYEKLGDRPTRKDYYVSNPLFVDDVTDLVHPGTLLLRRGKTALQGINSTYWYLSVTEDSPAPIHIEDFQVGSVNYLVAGAPKVWTMVNIGDKESFEAKVQEEFGANQDCSQFVREQSIIVSPDKLDEWGVTYTIIQQEVGEMIVTLPGLYHQVYNKGPNFAVSVNFEFSGMDDPGYIFCHGELCKGTSSSDRYEPCTPISSGRLPLKEEHSDLGKELEHLDHVCKSLLTQVPWAIPYFLWRKAKSLPTHFGADANWDEFVLRIVLQIICKSRDFHLLDWLLFHDAPKVPSKDDFLSASTSLPNKPIVMPWRLHSRWAVIILQDSGLTSFGMNQANAESWHAMLQEAKREQLHLTVHQKYVRPMRSLECCAVVDSISCPSLLHGSKRMLQARYLRRMAMQLELHCQQVEQKSIPVSLNPLHAEACADVGEGESDNTDIDSAFSRNPNVKDAMADSTFVGLSASRKKAVVELIFECSFDRSLDLAEGLAGAQGTPATMSAQSSPPLTKVAKLLMAMSACQTNLDKDIILRRIATIDFHEEFEADVEEKTKELDEYNASRERTAKVPSSDTTQTGTRKSEKADVAVLHRMFDELESQKMQLPWSMKERSDPKKKFREVVRAAADDGARLGGLRDQIGWHGFVSLPAGDAIEHLTDSQAAHFCKWFSTLQPQIQRLSVIDWESHLRNSDTLNEDSYSTLRQQIKELQPGGQKRKAPVADGVPRELRQRNRRVSPE